MSFGVKRLKSQENKVEVNKKRNNHKVGELQWSQSVKVMFEAGRRDKYKQRGK